MQDSAAREGRCSRQHQLDPFTRPSFPRRCDGDNTTEVQTQTLTLLLLSACIGWSRCVGRDASQEIRKTTATFEVIDFSPLLQTTSLRSSPSYRHTDEMPSTPLRATLTRFRPEPSLPRSSHSFSIIDGTAHLFGGEIRAREPVDTLLYSFSLKSGSESDARVRSSTIEVNGDAPPARVGHTAAKVNGSIYIWGGRNGVDPKPLEENGRVWRFSTSSKTWTALDPASGSSYPESRSYHSSTSDESSGNIYIHAGCPASGRQTDLWKFSVEANEWKQLASAPAPARGGPGFTFALGKLWRYGGFDGKNELGGQLDYLDVTTENAEWKSVKFAGGACPGGRSVTGLHAIQVDGQDYLVAYFGERDASSLGHAGAGVFWGDIWALGLTKAGEPASDEWTQCRSDGEAPERGWFASDLLDDSTIVVYGGLNGKNERESDGVRIAFSAS